MGLIELGCISSWTKKLVTVDSSSTGKLSVSEELGENGLSITGAGGNICAMREVDLSDCK